MIQHLLNTLIVLATLATGCNCVDGEGPVNTKTYDLSDVSAIEIDGSIEVRIKQGSPQTIELTAQQNLLGIITIIEEKGVLKVGSEQCYNTGKQSYLDITVARLESLHAHGSGDISASGQFILTELEVDLYGSGSIAFEQVDAAEINVEIDGSGDIQFAGETKELSAVINGSGSIMLGKLRTETAQAEISGSGDIELNVIDELDAEVSGSGSIRYKGTPKVKSDISGAGEVSPL